MNILRVAGQHVWWPMEKCAESNTHLFELSYYLSFSSLNIYIIDSHFQENSSQWYLYMSDLGLDYTFCTCESAGVFLGPNDINFIITRCAKWSVDRHMPANFWGDVWPQTRPLRLYISLQQLRMHPRQRTFSGRQRKRKKNCYCGVSSFPCLFLS